MKMEKYQNLKILDLRKMFHLSYMLILTLSEAHFSGASTPDMIVTIRVFGVVDYESEVRFSKW